MSKSTDNVLLVPGEAGWEIWSAAPGAPYALKSATAFEQAGELTDLPAGEIVLLFPVKAVTAVPMRVSSDDDALFPDLAAMHAERLGLRPDPMAGQLTDVFVIAREAENSALVSILLRTPGEGELPPRGPKGFDISPRAYAPQGDSLAVWKEFGRWVFSLYHQGKLVYCQATSIVSGSPDESLAREIRLALIQLSMQGLEMEPSGISIWTNSEGVSSASLAAAFRAPVSISPRPAPALPEPPSKLLPADVRAARKEALKRRNILLGAAAVGLVYLGLIGWFGYGLWKDISTTKQLEAQAESLKPEELRYTTHIAKWDELADLQLKNSPVELLSKVASCIPPNSGLRLKSAELSSAEIKLQGEAQTFEPANTFSLNLNKNRDLEESFTWETPPAGQSTRGWDFTYNATSKALATQQ